MQFTAFLGDKSQNYIENRTLLPPFRTPRAGRIVRFLRDEELALFDFKSRVVMKNYKQGALPATVATQGKPDFVPLTRAWQELWFECMKWQAGGTMTHEQLLEAWKSATMHSRALTDLHSREQGYRDWILGVNMSGSDMEQRLLSTAGNIAETLTGGSKMPFKALDPSKAPPRIDTIWGNHTLIWWATETDRPNWFDGGRLDINGRWPQLGMLGVPFLNVAQGGINYVSSERVALVANDIDFSPYHPITA